MKRVAVALVALCGVAHAQDNPEAPPASHEGKEATPEIEDPSANFNFANIHYRDKDELGGPLGDGKMVDDKTGVTIAEEEPMSPPFLLALLNFGVLLLLLGKYLVPAGRKVAEERHDQIKTALDEAAKLRAQAEAKLGEYEARIAGVDAEIDKLVTGIRADAEADKRRILASAENQAAQLKRDAEQRIAAEIELARQQLTDEVAAAAAAAASKIVRERATADDQQRLVSTFTTGLRDLGGPS